MSDATVAQARNAVSDAPASSAAYTSPNALLSKDERCRRAELADKAREDLEAHLLMKQGWDKRWKQRREFLQELIVRLGREAAKAVDEGGQLCIPGTEPEAEPEMPADRWSQLAHVERPRVTAWTLEQAELSTTAKALLELLEGDGKEKPAMEEVDLKDIPRLLSVTEDAALDAVCELAFFGLVSSMSLSNGSRTRVRVYDRFGRQLLQVSRTFHETTAPVDLVLEELPATTTEPVTLRQLQTERMIPRRVLLPVLVGLTRMGALEVAGEGWQRVARVAAWEEPVLEALERGGPLSSYNLREVLAGSMDLDWTCAHLHEAGEIRRVRKTKGEPGYVLERCPRGERTPLTDEQVGKVILGAFGKYDRTRSLEELVRDIDLPAARVERVAGLLVKDSKLQKEKKPHHNSHEKGPWWSKPEKPVEPKGKDKKDKGKTAKKAVAKASKTAPKAAKKPATKPARKAPAKPAPAPATPAAPSPEDSAKRREELKSTLLGRLNVPNSSWSLDGLRRNLAKKFSLAPSEQEISELVDELISEDKACKRGSNMILSAKPAAKASGKEPVGNLKPENVSPAPAAAPVAMTLEEAQAELRERVVAEMKRSKVRRSARVLGTLLGASEQDAKACLLELVSEGLVMRIGTGYQWTEAWKASRTSRTAPSKGKGSAGKAKGSPAPAGPAAAAPAPTTPLIDRIEEKLRQAPGGELPTDDLVEQLGETPTVVGREVVIHLGGRLESSRRRLTPTGHITTLIRLGPAATVSPAPSAPPAPPGPGTTPATTATASRKAGRGRAAGASATATATTATETPAPPAPAAPEAAPTATATDVDDEAPLPLGQTTEQAVAQVLREHGPQASVIYVASLLAYDVAGSDPEAQRTYADVLRALETVGEKDSAGFWRLKPEAAVAPAPPAAPVGEAPKTRLWRFVRAQVVDCLSVLLLTPGARVQPAEVAKLRGLDIEQVKAVLDLYQQVDLLEWNKDNTYSLGKLVDSREFAEEAYAFMRDAVVGMLDDNEGLSVTQLASILDAPEGLAQDVLDKLADKGQAHLTKRGEWERGPAPSPAPTNTTPEQLSLVPAAEPASTPSFDLEQLRHLWARCDKRSTSTGYLKAVHSQDWPAALDGLRLLEVAGLILGVGEGDTRRYQTPTGNRVVEGLVVDRVLEHVHQLLAKQGPLSRAHLAGLLSVSEDTTEALLRRLQRDGRAASSGALWGAGFQAKAAE